VHNTHTALIAGWSTQMVLYELILVDPSDPVYNPIWRQGNYVIPFISRLGVVQSFQLVYYHPIIHLSNLRVHFNKSSFSFRITLLSRHMALGILGFKSIHHLFITPTRSLPYFQHTSHNFIYSLFWIWSSPPIWFIWSRYVDIRSACYCRLY
jgi:hypothetical protein